MENIKINYYDVIIKQLQDGWLDYLEKTNQSVWLDDVDIYTDEHHWYNQCWNDWVKLNYDQNKEHYMSKIEDEIWDELLNIHIIKIKVVIYILLILFGYYITNIVI